jgi:hypothetical protein
MKRSRRVGVKVKQAPKPFQEAKSMKRILTLLSFVLLALSASNAYNTTASRPEKTIVVRVKAADSIKPLRFSGWYRADGSDARVQVDKRSAPFGVKMTTNSLQAAFRKESGEVEMCVEVIEFIGEKENGSVSGTGNNLEVEVRSDGAESRISVRPAVGS